MQQMDSQLHSNTPVQSSYLLNCCRVLTRIMPYVFESPDCSDWENNFFWTPRLVEKMDDTQKKSSQYITLPPRAEALISCK